MLLRMNINFNYKHWVSKWDAIISDMRVSSKLLRKYEYKTTKNVQLLFSTSNEIVWFVKHYIVILPCSWDKSVNALET